jgi:hypothetical protein
LSEVTLAGEEVRVLELAAIGAEEPGAGAGHDRRISIAKKLCPV